jgi:hypothetical protein
MCRIKRVFETETLALVRIEGEVRDRELAELGAVLAVAPAKRQPAGHPGPL